MNKIFLICCFISSNICVKAQDNYYNIVKPRINVIPNKGQAVNTDEYIVLKRDTLYAPLKEEPNLDFVESSRERRKLVYNYEAQVFRLTTEKSKTVYRLKQWSVPIIVYIDKDIPKEIRNDFITFFSQIKNIDNLSISFTSKLKDANYYIKTSTETINIYGDDDDFETEEERLNSTYYAGTYRLITDDNYKLHAGVLKVNLNDIPNDTKLLRQLKQLFFMSLGNFYLLNYYPEDSLLSEKYNNNDEFSIADINMLKMHYSIVYEQIINGSMFNKLQNLQKRK